jgi:hypothetical protein
MHFMRSAVVVPSSAHDADWRVDDDMTTRYRPREPKEVVLCHASGKVRYRDKDAASAALPKYTNGVIAYYACDDCYGYHMTSKPTSSYRHPLFPQYTE